MRLSVPVVPAWSLLAPVLLLPSCASQDDGGSGAGAAESPSPFVQTSFRVEGAAVTEAGSGTVASAPSEAIVVLADHPFAVRMEVEGVPGPEARFGLQVRRNGGAWEPVLARDFPYPDEISTPRVSIVSGSAVPGDVEAPTNDVLDGSATPFLAATAISLDSLSGPWPSSPVGEAPPLAHGEWVWPVVIRRWADGAVTNEDGDVFELRMVDGRGHPVLPPDGRPFARVVLEIPEGLLGGTYAETPGVLGPWQTGDGSLYFPMEPAETFNVLMMMRSSDGGRHWEEVDGAHRPATDDLEGFATAFHQGRIYLLHQISEAVYLHAFRTPDAPDAPDDLGDAGSWDLRDELVTTHSEPPVQVAALAARSDGSLVAAYGDSLGLELRVRTPAGGWGDALRISGDPGRVASGVMAVVGDDDTVHLAYTSGDLGGREVRYAALAPDGQLSDPQVVAQGVGVTEEEFGAVAPLGFLPGTGTVAVLYRLADGSLRERRVGADGAIGPEARVTERGVVQNGSDSDQVGADVVVHEDAIHVLFIDEETRDLWHTFSERTGIWSPARPAVSDVNAQWIRGSVVRGADGRTAYGFVDDAGSDGGSGMNRNGEIRLGPDR